MASGYFCHTCGAYHDELPMDFGADAPALYFMIPPEERSTRCELTDDICMVDEESFFIRGCLEIPVIDGDRPLVWGVWASLSQPNFARVAEIWEHPDRQQEPPMFGWLSTSLPNYPETLHLKTMVYTREVGTRPYIELEPTDHPLAIEQREGISTRRVEQIASAMLHPDSPQD